MTTESVTLSRDEPFPLPTERRYPLDLSTRIPELRRLYHESNASIWNVADDLDITAIDVDRLDDQTRAAAALSWSRRAWLSFADISESEAALVRSCLELDREADFKFVLATRGTERAVAADACHRIAQRLGGYRATPPEGTEALFTAEPIRRALDERVDFDAYVVAHFVVLATIDRALLETAVAATTDATCRGALERILVDIERQETAGRIYAEARLDRLDDDARATVTANVVDVVRLDVLSGRRCVAFVDEDIAGGAELRMAEELTAHAGLGAATLVAQGEAVTAALAALHADLDRLGLDGGAATSIETAPASPRSPR
ncbi:MAG: hypothetical protein RIE08_13760 [Acidimicrobiales bacterium]